MMRNQIADMDFNSTTYAAIFDKADSVWSANSTSTSAAAALEASVAAIGGRGSGRGGGRGGKPAAAGADDGGVPRPRRGGADTRDQ